MVAFLPFRARNAAAAKNAVEEFASRTRDQKCVMNLAKHLNLGAFEADDKICLLLVSSDVYSVSRVETKRHIALILCNCPLESGYDFLSSFSVLDNSRAEDFVPIKIFLGRLPLGMR